MSASGTRDRSRGNFYEILGVPRDADPDAIQSAYRRLARRYHPDINSDPRAEERFKEVSEAYDILSDPESRKRYDRFGRDFRRMPEGAEHWAGAGAGAGARAGPGAGPGTGGGGGPDARFEGFSGFEGFGVDDLFGGFFRRRDQAGPVPGADQEAEIEVGLAEAYHGGRRRITLPASGGGTREVEVTIPAGVTDGQRLRLAGQGGQGRGGGGRGDLYLVVRLAPDPRFRVEGRDVYIDLPLAPWEGVLGARVTLPNPAGGEATLTVPPGTSTGRRLRLRGRGLPRPGRAPYRGEGAGDLYAHARIMVPPKPTERERELFAELAGTSSFNPRER